MSAAGVAASAAAKEAAGNAGRFFSGAWGSAKGMFGKAGEAATSATKGVGSSVKAADQYLGVRIAEDKGVWGAVKGMSKEHPVYATLAGTGVAAATVYGGSKAIGHFTGREDARRRAQASADRDR